MAVGRGYLAMYALRDGSNATRNTRCSNGTEIDCTIRSLLKNIGRSKRKQSNELKKCLQEMAEDSDKSVFDSAEWTRAIRRSCKSCKSGQRRIDPCK